MAGNSSAAATLNTGVSVSGAKEICESRRSYAAGSAYSGCMAGCRAAEQSESYCSSSCSSTAEGTGRQAYESCCRELTGSCDCSGNSNATCGDSGGGSTGGDSGGCSCTTTNSTWISCNAQATNAANSVYCSTNDLNLSDSAYYSAMKKCMGSSFGQCACLQNPRIFECHRS